MEGNLIINIHNTRCLWYENKPVIQCYHNCSPRWKQKKVFPCDKHDSRCHIAPDGMAVCNESLKLCDIGSHSSIPRIVGVKTDAYRNQEKCSS